MDWFPEYIKAWSRHNIHFGLSVSPKRLVDEAGLFRTALSTLNIIEPPGALPDRFTPTIAVEDESLIYRFPHSYRTRQRRGRLNERFLGPVSLLRVLDGLPERVIILLSIPQIWPTEGLSCGAFLGKLDRFLSALPASLRFAIELHNANYLLPDYYECLHQHNVAHVIHNSPVFTTTFGLIHTAGHSEIICAVRTALEEKKTLYVYAHEPAAINQLMEPLNNDLKRLSPIKHGAAA